MSEEITEKNQRLAIVLLVKELMDQIDEIASLQRQGASANLSKQMLKEMGGILQELSPDMKEYYLNTLMTLTDKAPINKAQFSEDYATHSVNSKRRLVSKIREDLKLKAA